jgi:murein DD-endopeptidase
MSKYRLYHTFFLLLFLFVSCKQEAGFVSVEKKIPPQKDSLKHLNNTLSSDSLTLAPLELDTLRGNIQARQGFVPLLRSMGLANVEAIAIGDALKENVDLTKIRLGEEFMVLRTKDSLPQSLYFEYVQKRRFKHILEKEKDTWNYTLEELPVHHKLQNKACVIEKGMGFWQLLKKAGIPSSEVHYLSHALTRAGLHRKTQVGDTLWVLLEHSIHPEGDTLASKIIKAEYPRRQKTLWKYPAKEGFFLHGYYTEDGASLQKAEYLWPLRNNSVSCEFGGRRHPVTGRRSFHSGVDFLANTGDSVFAIASGIVSKSTYGSTGGHYINIKHPNGYKSMYLHLDKRLVNVGEKVQQGQLIAYSGNTGRSTNAHLHLELKTPGGRSINALRKKFGGPSQLNGQYWDRFKMYQRNIERAWLENQNGQILP